MSTKLSARAQFFGKDALTLLNDFVSRLSATDEAKAIEMLLEIGVPYGNAGKMSVLPRERLVAGLDLLRKSFVDPTGGADGGGAIAAGAEFVFQPGGSPIGNTFDDWEELVAAAKDEVGLVTIAFDDTFAACVIPAGDHDLENSLGNRFILRGKKVAGNSMNGVLDEATAVAIADGATLNGIVEIRDLKIDDQSDAVVITLANASLILSGATELSVSGAGPMISIGNTQVDVLMNGMARLVQATGQVFSVGATGELLFLMNDKTRLENDTLAGAAGASIDVDMFSASVVVSTSQVDVDGGSISTPSRSAKGENVEYNPANAGIAPDTLQRAIDWLITSEIDGVPAPLTYPLLDNQAVPVATGFAFAKTRFTGARLLYTIVRDANREVGEILIVNDGTTPALDVRSKKIGDAEITFSVDISGAFVRLLYTSSDQTPGAGTLNIKPDYLT